MSGGKDMMYGQLYDTTTAPDPSMWDSGFYPPPQNNFSFALGTFPLSINSPVSCRSHFPPDLNLTTLPVGQSYFNMNFQPDLLGTCGGPFRAPQTYIPKLNPIAPAVINPDWLKTQTVNKGDTYDTSNSVSTSLILEHTLLTCMTA